MSSPILDLLNTMWGHTNTHFKFSIKSRGTTTVLQLCLFVHDRDAGPALLQSSLFIHGSHLWVCLCLKSKRFPTKATEPSCISFLLCHIFFLLVQVQGNCLAGYISNPGFCSENTTFHEWVLTLSCNNGHDYHSRRALLSYKFSLIAQASRPHHRLPCSFPKIGSPVWWLESSFWKIQLTAKNRKGGNLDLNVYNQHKKYQSSEHQQCN